MALARIVHFVAPQLPSAREWIHEIKHDGFRLIASRDRSAFG
jgi:ATP-dependent DNA ligase